MYVAVKGGERAIAKAHKLLAEKRRGDPSLREIGVHQIENQLGLAVDRVMTEGSLYDRELAALALKQSQGDQVEAIFLVRAFRTTLARIGVSEPIDTARMRIGRRVSAAFKDIPGGQVLGPTYDYTHRLMDFSLTLPEEERDSTRPPTPADRPLPEVMPRITEILKAEGLIEETCSDDDRRPVGDLTRRPLQTPAERDTRLQNLARGDEGFLLSMAYSLQRGFGLDRHPFTGEIRYGEVSVEFVPEELGFPVVIGEIEITECVIISRFPGSEDAAPQFKKGYGLTFGHCERKAMAMALVDRALRGREFGESSYYPAQDEEFVLFHSDNVEASGFVQHLKLPHYVDFQAELVEMRRMRSEYQDQSEKNDEGEKTYPLRRKEPPPAGQEPDIESEARTAP
ncbi:MAG: carbon-phosphorus lyase complex subunit PhnI [Deltaproteobacteria bacterium]|nr:carbon-phosphorus lyase complex subunit PhnI [Deltaproteobacteria bacterium]